MSFHDSTRFIFEFLLKLAHISRLKVFMQYLRFLDFYMSNDPKLELELRKLAEFRLVRFLGPRTVRACWAEAVSVSCSVKNFKGGRSAKGPRTVRDWTELWGRPDLTYIGCP